MTWSAIKSKTINDSNKLSYKRQKAISLNVSHRLKVWKRLWLDTLTDSLQSNLSNFSSILPLQCLAKDNCNPAVLKVGVLCMNNLRKSVCQTVRWEETCKITRYNPTLMKLVQTAQPHTHNLRYQYANRDKHSHHKPGFLWIWVVFVEQTVFFLLRVPIKL